MLKPWKSNGLGHLKVGLGERRREWLHRVICLAFYGPCPADMEVRHLDGDPANNRVDNLRYGTHSENMHNRVRHGRASVPRAPWVRTQCPQGHPYDTANTLTYGGKRSCRACVTEHKAAYVKRQAGARTTCGDCGHTASKLNFYKHQCQRSDVA